MSEPNFSRRFLCAFLHLLPTSSLIATYFSPFVGFKFPKLQNGQPCRIYRTIIPASSALFGFKIPLMANFWWLSTKPRWKQTHRPRTGSQNKFPKRSKYPTFRPREPSNKSCSDWCNLSMNWKVRRQSWEVLRMPVAKAATEQTWWISKFQVTSEKFL